VLTTAVNRTLSELLCDPEAGKNIVYFPQRGMAILECSLCHSGYNTRTTLIDLSSGNWEGLARHMYRFHEDAINVEVR
jgi:hypothetical protein